MTPDSRNTAAILGCAGALVAAAIVLQRSSAGGTERLPPVHEAQLPPAAPTEGSCDTGAPARTSASFTRGTLGAALSAGKIVRATGGEIYAAFELATEQALTAERPSLDIALVIDRSGSMQGDKIASAKKAAYEIIGRLGDRDRAALIQYDDSAQVVVPSIPTDQEGKERLRSAIYRLEVGGSTNLHGGLELGRDEVRRTLTPGQVSRVILLSDGQANSGVVDPVRIANTARGAADQGVRITTVGLGLDFNEDLMEAIAEAGRGNYYYVKDAAGLGSVMAGELAGVQSTVAGDVQLRLRSGCAGVELAEVIGYQAHRDGDALVVPMADLFGGDSRELLVRLVVPDRQTGRIGAIEGELSFRDAKTGEAKTARVALAVEVTDDFNAAAGSVDKVVMAQVLKAQAAHGMRQAAEAYDRGDVEGARRVLDETRGALQAKGSEIGLAPEATAAAAAPVEEMDKAARELKPGSEGGKDLLKASKARARDLVKRK